MNRERIQIGSLVVPIVLAVFYILNSLAVALQWGAEEDDRTGYIVLGLIGVSAGSIMLAGVSLEGRAPWLGAGVLAAGAIIMASAAYWLWPVMVPITLVAIAFAAFRAKESTRERRRAAASPADRL